MKKFKSGALLFQPDVRKIIEEEPEVVIRCKDCGHYKHYECLFGECFECEVFEYPTKETDFCSRAERRDDGNSDLDHSGL